MRLSTTIFTGGREGMGNGKWEWKETLTRAGAIPAIGKRNQNRIACSLEIERSKGKEERKGRVERMGT